MKPLIVGVDPGSTSAVAALDFEGEKVFVKSRKNFPPREIIAEIVDYGRPVVVASDKKKFPSTVEKVASSVGAYRYELDKDLSRERKNTLGEGDNDHEKDAVAAAMNAFRGLRDNIKTIKELSRERSEETSLIALEYFDDSLDTKSKKSEAEDSSDVNEFQPVENEVPVSERVKSLEDENERLSKTTEHLQEQVEDLKKELKTQVEKKENWQSKYDRMRTEKRQEIMKERVLTKKQAELKEKEEKIQELEEKLEKAFIRENQYDKALELLEGGGEILRFIESMEERKGPAVTRSEEVKELMTGKGETVFHVDELEGVELSERFVLEKRPEKDLKKLLEEYRDAR